MVVDTAASLASVNEYRFPYDPGRFTAARFTKAVAGDVEESARVSASSDCAANDPAPLVKRLPTLSVPKSVAGAGAWGVGEVAVTRRP